MTRLSSKSSVRSQSADLGFDRDAFLASSTATRFNILAKRLCCKYSKCMELSPEVFRSTFADENAELIGLSSKEPFQSVIWSRMNVDEDIAVHDLVSRLPGRVVLVGHRGTGKTHWLRLYEREYAGVVSDQRDYMTYRGTDWRYDLVRDSVTNILRLSDDEKMRRITSSKLCACGINTSADLDLIEMFASSALLNGDDITFLLLDPDLENWIYVLEQRLILAYCSDDLVDFASAEQYADMRKHLLQQLSDSCRPFRLPIVATTSLYHDVFTRVSQTATELTDTFGGALMIRLGHPVRFTIARAPALSNHFDRNVIREMGGYEK